MTYEEAKKQLKKAKGKPTEGDVALLERIEVLAMANAINSELVYNGAKSKGIDVEQLRRMDIMSVSDLMFV